MTAKYDTIVIGGGPGGYVATLKASSLGQKVALVEKGGIGGTCLYMGCIPTKTLIRCADVAYQIQHAKTFGIHVKDVMIDYPQMIHRKNDVIGALSRGVTELVKSSGIDLYKGEGSFISKTEVKVTDPSNVILEGKNIIIATGSISATLPHIPIDYHQIHDSTSILEMTSLPKKLTVIGGGYIGCEFASLFNALGVKVEIVEFLPGLVLAQGKTISQFLHDSFIREGIKIHLNVKVDKVTKNGPDVECLLSNEHKITSNIVLVSVGRKPYTEGLRLNNAGLGTDPQGFITVDDAMETAVKGIYAIGDVTGKSMLAHTASHQGIVAAENISLKKSKINYGAIPAVIFTHPEIATVGYTLEQALEKKFDAMKAQTPLAILGKAKATGEEIGFSEIVFDKKNHAILGGSIIGHNAGELIMEITSAIQNELTLESLETTIHPHPTFSEIWAESVALALGHPLHMPKKKKS